MCLDRIYKRKPKISGAGYKVFVLKDNGELEGDIISDKTIPTETWISADGFRPGRFDNGTIDITSRGASQYTLDWHIFRHLSGARWWWMMEPIKERVIKKVSYRNAHTQGEEGDDGDSHGVVIANEMYVHTGEIKGETNHA